MYSGYNYYDRETSSQGNEINDPNSIWFQQEPHWMLIEELLTHLGKMAQIHGLV